MALVCKLLAVLPQGRSLKALGGHPTRLHNEGHNGGRCGQVVRSNFLLSWLPGAYRAKVDAMGLSKHCLAD